MSNIILGIIDNDEYRQKYTKNNERSKHLSDREERINLSIENAEPVYFYEVFRKRDNIRQVHCLYADSTLIIFNKKDGMIITVILLGRNKLEEYLKIAGDILSDQLSMQRCAKLHDRLLKNNGELTEDMIENVIERKIKYIDND